MARKQARLYGTAAIRRQLFKAMIWGGVVAYLLYVAIEVRPSRYSLAAEPPAAVSLADFSRRTDLHERNEANVIGRIDSRDGVPVTQNGMKVHFFMFFAPESGPEDTVVRAAVLIKPEDLEIYKAELAEYPDESPIKINGRVLNQPNHPRAAEAMMRDRSLTRSDQFVYITPWLGDRRDPLDNGPWFDIVLIALFSLPMLYHLFVAVQWYRNDRAVMSMLSDEQVEMVKRSMKQDRGSGNILIFLILVSIVIAYVIKKYL